jgi:hypothetical protein
MCVCVYEYTYGCYYVTSTAQYKAKSVSFFGVCLILTSIIIQRWVCNKNICSSTLFWCDSKFIYSSKDILFHD